MTTLTALEERVLTLEDFCFEQLPHTLGAMNLGMTKIYAETVANGEAIAGLHVDMASLEATVRGDIAALKHATSMQGDSLRKEIGVTAASLRADMTSFREAVSQRFGRVDTQLRGLRGDMNASFGGVDERLSSVGQRFDAADQRFDTIDQRFDTVDQRFDAVDGKLDTLIAEIRRNKH